MIMKTDKVTSDLRSIVHTEITNYELKLTFGVFCCNRIHLQLDGTDELASSAVVKWNSALITIRPHSDKLSQVCRFKHFPLNLSERRDAVAVSSPAKHTFKCFDSIFDGKRST